MNNTTALLVVLGLVVGCDAAPAPEPAAVCDAVPAMDIDANAIEAGWDCSPDSKVLAATGAQIAVDIAHGWEREGWGLVEAPTCSAAGTSVRVYSETAGMAVDATIGPGGSVKGVVQVTVRRGLGAEPRWCQIPFAANGR